MKVSNSTVRLSTLIGVIVLILALSTATFAWFTTSASITAGVGSFTASTEGDGDLELYWGNSNVKVSLETDTENNFKEAVDMMPMIPSYTDNPTTVANATTSNTPATYDQFIDKFLTSTVTTTTTTLTTGEGEVTTTKSVFTRQGIKGTPFTIQNVDNPAYNYMTVKSKGVDKTATVGLGIQFTAPQESDNHKKLRVAVFQNSTIDGTKAFYYLGTIGTPLSADDVNYTYIAHGDIIKGQETSSVVYKTGDHVWQTVRTEITITPQDADFTQNANNAEKWDMAVELKFVVWYDGEMLKDGTNGGAGEEANINIQFSL